MKQLIIYADMEGASGIFDDNLSWLMNGSDDYCNWRGMLNETWECPYTSN